MSNLIILRPQNLFYLFKSLDKLSGIGEKKIRVLEIKIGPNIINTLCYLPIKSIDSIGGKSIGDFIMKGKLKAVITTITEWKTKDKNMLLFILIFIWFRNQSNF